MHPPVPTLPQLTALRFRFRDRPRSPNRPFPHLFDLRVLRARLHRCTMGTLRWMVVCMYVYVCVYVCVEACLLVAGEAHCKLRLGLDRGAPQVHVLAAPPALEFAASAVLLLAHQAWMASTI